MKKKQEQVMQRQQTKLIQQMNKKTQHPKVYRPIFIPSSNSRNSLEISYIPCPQNGYKNITIKRKQQQIYDNYKTFEGIARAQQPIPLNSCVCSYFQMHLVKKQEKDKQEKSNNQAKIKQEEQKELNDNNLWDDISIGFTTDKNASKLDMFQMPGLSTDNSFGIKGSSLYYNGIKVDDFQFKLKGGDTLGIGFIHQKSYLFFTKNGQLLQNQFYLQKQKMIQIKQKPITLQSTQYYPTICLPKKGQQIQLTFQNNSKNFKYNFLQKEKGLKQKCKIISHYFIVNFKVIDHSEMTEAKMYRLVHDYLRFNCYRDTSLKYQMEMMKKGIKYQMAKYPKDLEEYNHLINEELKVKEEEAREKEESKGYKKKQKKSRRQSDSDHEELHFGDTDYEQSDPSTPSDQDQQQWFTFEQFMKKEGYLKQKKPRKIEHPTERKARRAKYKKQKQQILFRERQKKYSQQRQKLLEETDKKFKTLRMSIIQNIRGGKLQVAQRIFSVHFSKIYKNNQYIDVYFKIHIFLRKFQQDGMKIAFKYLQQFAEEVERYEKNLFPFYRKNNPKGEPYLLRPLKEIFLLLLSDSKVDFDLQKQLHVFSLFIHQLICKKMGYRDLSRLDYAINHYIKIQQICDKSKIPCTNKQIISDDK